MNLKRWTDVGRRAAAQDSERPTCEDVEVGAEDVLSMARFMMETIPKNAPLQDTSSILGEWL